MDNIKILDESGLKKVFELVSQKDKKLEDDITLVLNGIANELENKANKSDTVVNADWDAEEGEAGFIKNKPVVEISNNKLFYKKESTNSSKFNSNGYYFYQDNAITITENKIYLIQIDDKEYRCNSIQVNNHGTPIISNGEIDSTNNLNNFPYSGDFCIYKNNNYLYCYIKSNKEISNLEIFEIVDSKKQFDPKYIPIVQETGDSETSIMSQKAVTEALANVGGSSEVNADWDAQEGEEGFIKNKPFYEIKKENEEIANMILSLGNSSDGKLKKVYYNDGNTNCKLPENFIYGFLYKIIILPNTKNEKEYYSIAKKSIDGVIYISTENIDNINFNNISDVDVSQYSNTVFVFTQDVQYNNYKGAGSYGFIIEKINSEVKQLDSKYLPIVQETGDSETSIMSQKAITNAIPKTWTGTQSEYDAITTKDSNTFYFIKEEE